MASGARAQRIQYTRTLDERHDVCQCMSIGDVMSLRGNTRSGVHSHRQMQRQQGIGIVAGCFPYSEETFPGDAEGRTERE